MLRAIVRTGGTHVAAVEDKAVVDIFPIFFRNEQLEVVRYLLEIAVIGQVETARKTLHVCVSRNSLPNIKELAQDNMRGFVADAGKLLQIFRILGDAAMAGNMSRR